MAGTATDPLRTGRVLAEAWEIYRRELLVAIPAAFAARVTVVLAATLVVEVPLLLLHLGTGEVALELTSDRFDVYVGALLAAVWGGLGHHLLVGVLERVVGAERHGHERPTLGRVLRDLPWGRLVVADIALTTLTVVALAAFVVPALLVVTFFACVMPLLSMRREDLRTVWGSSTRLVRGSARAVLGAVALAWAVQSIVLGAVAAVVHALTADHGVEVVVHGLVAIVVVPFSALVPVVITFDLLARRGDPASTS